MIIIVIIVNRRGIGHGRVRLGPRIRFRLRARFVGSPHIQHQIVQKNKHISRPNKPTILQCCCNHNTTNSVKNLNTNRKEESLLLQTLTGKSCCQLDKTPQGLQVHNHRHNHITKLARIKSLPKKKLQTVTCLNLRMIDLLNLEICMFIKNLSTLYESNRINYGPIISFKNLMHDNLLKIL